MEKDSLTIAVKNSISDVLEKMFFLPIDFLDTHTDEENQGSTSKEELICTVKFEGPFSGYFLIGMSNKLALHITSYFLGQDIDLITTDQINEAIKEVINMIAGNTLSSYDEHSVFNLGLPKITGSFEAGKNFSNPKENIFIAVNTLENEKIKIDLVVGQ